MDGTSIATHAVKFTTRRYINVRSAPRMNVSLTHILVALVHEHLSSHDILWRQLASYLRHDAWCMISGNLSQVRHRHCTASRDALGDNVNHANDVQNVFGMEFKIATTDVWMFREEIGLEVEFAQQQCDLMYQSMNITPHITLIVTKRTQSKGDWNNNHVSKGFARTSVCVGCEAEICVA